MPTMRDVARVAGVSLGTVSRVINDHADVSPELRRKVQEAIRELEYEPNVLARNMRRQRTGTLGIVLPDLTAPFFTELLRQTERAAGDAGFAVLVGNSSGSRDIEGAYLTRFADRGVDGLIFCPSEDVQAVDIPRRLGLVAIDRELQGYDLVSCDHEAGAAAAVEHLFELGHRRIACIAGPSTVSVFRQRLAGYRAVAQPTLRELGIAPDTYVQMESLDRQRGLESAHALLAQEPRPTAIFACSDQQAAGVLSACTERGLRCPEDVSVIGFDDIPLAAMTTPRLSTVRQPIEAIADAAVAQVLTRIESREAAPQRRILPGQLRLRQSTAPPPAG